MDFLVYERDPLVRTDIVETLKDAFVGVTHLLDDICELCVGSVDRATPSVLILSVPERDLLEKITDIMKAAAPAGIVIICDDPPAEAQRWSGLHFVPRPFHSGTLVSAVRNALSSQQTILTGTLQ